MTNDNIINQVASGNVLDMLTVANEFCVFTEKAGNYNPIEVYKFYSKICPLLYLKGALLPEISPDDEFIGERFVNEDQWESIYNSLLTIFSAKDNFFTLSFETGDNIPLTASIAEHLADIYQDMKDFVLLFQKNLEYAKQNAVHECRELFISHWGARITSVMPALHTLCFASERDDELLYE